HVGLLDEALAHFSAALRSDPRDNFAPYRVARTRLYQGLYAEALDLYGRAEGTSFEVPLALAHLGRQAEALAATGRIGSVLGARGESDVAGTKAVVLALAGRRPESEAEAARAVSGGQGSSHFHHTAYNLATAQALLGERAKAVEWLDRAVHEGMPCTPLF